jgi:iron-sulfur cluster assembly accessory protein
MTSESATTTAIAEPAQATHTGRDGKGIQITESAMKQLATLLPAQGEGKVLRVGVRSGGCSGMSYTMDFIDASEIQADDKRYIYEPAGAPSFTVVSDPKSLLYIYGMQLDFSSALIGGGFNFTNPNATQTCGCGSSFAV